MGLEDEDNDPEDQDPSIPSPFPISPSPLYLCKGTTLSASVVSELSLSLTSWLVTFVLLLSFNYFSSLSYYWAEPD